MTATVGPTSMSSWILWTVKSQLNNYFFSVRRVLISKEETLQQFTSLHYKLSRFITWCNDADNTNISQQIPTNTISAGDTWWIAFYSFWCASDIRCKLWYPYALFCWNYCFSGEATGISIWKLVMTSFSPGNGTGLFIFSIFRFSLLYYQGLPSSAMKSVLLVLKLSLLSCNKLLSVSQLSIFLKTVFMRA